MDNKVLDLLEIRDQIDGIDKEIVELFEKRMQLSAEVAEYKISNNKAVLDPQREKEKLNTLEKYASNSFNRVGVYELFRQMMAMSRKLQYRILAEKGKAEKIPFRKVSSLPMQKAKVVFQGVEGAYSFTAMHSFFGESIENYNVETWKRSKTEMRITRYCQSRILLPVSLLIFMIFWWNTITASWVNRSFRWIML